MASRSHAEIVVEPGEARLEDLGSRNGILVNEERVHKSKVLAHGDRIRIGGQEIHFMVRIAVRTDTLAQNPITQRLQAFGLLGALADKALQMGNGNEAERILGRQLEHLLEQAERNGPLEEELFEKVVNYALRIAGLTKKAKWLDFLFRVHTSHGVLMASELVNELYALSRKVTGASRSHLRTYVSALHSKAPQFGPAERFVLGRLEGLEQLLN